MKRVHATSASLVCGALALAACAEIAGIRRGTLRETSAAAAGGGGSSSTSSTGGGGASMGYGAIPPGRPKSTSKPGTGKTVAFAPRRYFFGRHNVPPCELNVDTDTCPPNANAWRKMGFNIDGRTTTPELAQSESPGTCKRKTDWPLYLLEDGDDGRDNCFGNAFMSGLGMLIPGGSLEGRINKSLRLGDGVNLVFVLADVDEGPDDKSVLGYVYNSAIGSGVPVWDGSFRYKIDGNSLETSSITQPKLRFISGYVAGNVFVSNTFNELSEVAFSLPIQGTKGLAVVVPDTLLLAIQLSPDHTQALRATVSMVVDPSRFAEALRPVIHKYLGCKVDANGLLAQVYDYNDLSSGLPAFLDTTGTKFCDRMSIAFELDLQPVAPPVQADVVYPEIVDSCAAGGAGGSN